MKKPVAAQSASPTPQAITPGKKKSNYLVPIIVGFCAVAAFLLVWYFAVK